MIEQHREEVKKLIQESQQQVDRTRDDNHKEKLALKKAEELEIKKLKDEHDIKLVEKEEEKNKLV